MLSFKLIRLVIALLFLPIAFIPFIITFFITSEEWGEFIESWKWYFWGDKSC